MFERFHREQSEPYPGLKGAIPPLAYEQPYLWGSLKITDNAMEAYGLTVRPVDSQTGGDIEIEDITKRNFATDILIAAPGDVVAQESGDASLRVEVRRNIAKATLSMAHDKEIAGLNFTLSAIEGMTEEMDEELVPDFLRLHGTDIQEDIHHDLPVIMAHAFTEAAENAARDGYMLWGRKQDMKKALRPITMVGSTLFVGTAVVDGISLGETGHVEALPALLTAGYVGLMSLSARVHLRRELNLQPLRALARMDTAVKLSKLVREDVHALLCPGPGRAAGEPGFPS